MMTTSYWKDQSINSKFSYIPIGKKLKIIGLSVKDEIPYYFEQKIIVEKDKKVFVNFAASDLQSIKENLYKLNKNNNLGKNKTNLVSSQ